LKIDNKDSQIGHPHLDVLILLSRYDAVNPVFIHRELGIPLRKLHSVLNRLIDAGLVGYKRFTRYNYFITPKGREAASRIALK
jgi:helix-turn-helix protein